MTTETRVNLELTLIQETVKQTFSERKNLLAILLVLLDLTVWYGNRFLPKPPRDRIILLDPTPTRILQNIFSHPLLDYLTSYIWAFGYAIVITTLVVTVVARGRHAWRIGIPVALAWAINLAIQLMFPVIVPIRMEAYGLDPGIRNIPKETLRWTDNINGMLWAGLPSAHIGVACAAFISSYVGSKETDLENKTPYFIGMIVAIFFILAFSFSVIYLGEHYIEDILASLILWPIVVIGGQTVINQLFPPDDESLVKRRR